MSNNNLARAKDRNKQQPMKKKLSDAKLLEKARSALKAIHIWATFEHNGMPAGFLLVPDHVADLCERTLAETERDKDAVADSPGN